MYALNPPGGNEFPVRDQAALPGSGTTSGRSSSSWRRRCAHVDGVPAFLVAHDRTLAELARRRPTDRTALRACHGIGPAKVARYGAELLTLLARPVPTLPATGVMGVERGQ